jgi:hypothetical protein
MRGNPEIQISLCSFARAIVILGVWKTDFSHIRLAVCELKGTI